MRSDQYVDENRKRCACIRLNATDGVDLNGGRSPRNIVAPKATCQSEIIVLGVQRGRRLADTVTLRAIRGELGRPPP